MQPTQVQGDASQHIQETAQRAGRILARGGLVVFPTETVYGLGACVLSQRGWEALCRAKGQPTSHPFAVHLPDRTAAGQYVDLSDPRMGRLVNKVFPGPVTLVVELSESELERAARQWPEESLRQRLIHNGTVVLRCPDQPLARAVLAAAGGPVVAAGAGAPGGEPAYDAASAAAAVGSAAALVLDAGACRHAKPSTLVRVRRRDGRLHASVQREGVFDARYMHKLLRTTVLMVCTGNTCRSPMAQALAAQALARERGIAVDELETAGLAVLSAGLAASDGTPASDGAVAAMQRMGMDLSWHRSRAISPALLREADLIYCMTASHRQQILRIMADAAERTFVLDEAGDIQDPAGGSIEEYRRCAEQIRLALERRIREHQP